ncbi:metal-dependent hydrolase [bacterium]|nr:metal-dependent hydrolase [candidate division CSSED10-310 bacterium]
MDPLTHLMAGALIGHASAAFCPEPAATVTALGAAILPDFDFYARKYEGAKFLKIHHGSTHSVTGLFLQSAVTASCSWSFFRYVQVFDFQAARFYHLFLISLLSVSTHIFLDWIMHNNGLPLLWPFSPKRFCLPLILGVNPRTVSHECGEKHYFTCFGCQARGGFFNPVSWILIVPASIGFFTPAWRTMLGIVPWMITIVYLGFCALLRECARMSAERLESRAGIAHAYPVRSRPDRWLFVFEDDTYVTAILSDCVKQCVMRRWQYGKHSLSPGIAKAVESIQLDLIETIRHLYPVEISVSDGCIVEFRDLSYLSAEPTEIGTVRVYLNTDQKVLRDVYQEIW